MTTRDWSSFINKLTSWLVGVLAVIAFTLSYNALRHVASDYGVPEQLSYIWPLLVDFALIVFSLAVLRASLLGERTAWPWFLVGLFTVTTIGFNLVHAPVNLTSQVVAVVAPVALFLSFETLMGMVKSSVRRSGVIWSIEQLNNRLAELTSQVDGAKGDLDKLTVAKRALQVEIDTLQTDKQAAVDEKSKEVGVSTDKVALARNVIQRHLSEGLPLPSGAVIGQELNVSRTTGNKLKSILLPEFSQNGYVK